MQDIERAKAEESNKGAAQQKQMREEQELLESLKKHEMKNKKNIELKRKAIEDMKA